MASSALLRLTSFDRSIQLEQLPPHPHLRPQSPTLESLCGEDDTLSDQQTLIRERPSYQSHNIDQNPTLQDDEHNSLDISAKDEAISIRDIPGYSRPSHRNSENEGTSKTTHWRHVFFHWVLELLMLLLAAGLLIAIYVILDMYNDEIMPDWGYVGITLNTLIATLATIFRATIAFIIFEIIAQVKWDWFSVQFRPMAQLKLFEDASRGTYGSLRLLPIIALRRPLAVGAIVVSVVSLAIGPFIQQSINPYQCLRLSESKGEMATVNAANTIESYILDRSMGTGVSGALGIELQTAMQDSLVNPSNDSNIAALFDCQSGNCTFPTFSDRTENIDDIVSHASIGVCSRCIDVYDLVEEPKLQNNSSITIELLGDDEPLKLLLGDFNGIYMNIRVQNNLAWSRPVASDDFLNRARWSIANFSILATSRERCDSLPGNDFLCPMCKNNKSQQICDKAVTKFYRITTPTDYVAATCILYPCTKYFSAKVAKGALSENTVRDVPFRQQIPEPLPSAALGLYTPAFKGVQQPCYADGEIYTSSNMSNANLGPNKTTTVQFHTKDWAEESPSSPAEFTNITAPLSCIYEIPRTLLYAIRTTIQEQFSISCYPYTMIASLKCSNNGSETTFSSHLGAIMRNETTSMDIITNAIESLALRITTEIRKNGRGFDSTEKGMAEGEAWESRVCVQIRWSWLALPSTIFGLCSILLFWTIITDVLSGNSMIWKSSVFPLVLKDVPGLHRADLKVVEEIANGLELKIQKHKQA